MSNPWNDEGAPHTEQELREFSAGECEHTIHDRFDTLIANGCRASAWAIWDELGKKLRKGLPRPGAMR
jgi:hypothetical protein